MNIAEKGLIWYEVWAEEGSSPPYILILWSDVHGKIEVYDPIEKRICYVASSYEDAMYWLTEDEFTQVVGRMSEDWLKAPLS